MKLIGITGNSGSGKTTLANKLSQKLNCKMIDIDKQILSNDAFNNNINTIPNDEKLNSEQFKILIDNFEDRESLISVFINGIVETELQRISKEQGIVIVEWMLLPYLKVWEHCNTKVLITADENKRRENAINNKLITAEKYDKCFDSVKVNYEQFEYDYIFNNKYDEESIIKVLENF